jgi:hypothetical protein
MFAMEYWFSAKPTNELARMLHVIRHHRKPPPKGNEDEQAT